MRALSLKLIFRNKVIDELVKTELVLPRKIFDNCLQIIEMRKMKIQEELELAEKSQEESQGNNLCGFYGGLCALKVVCVVFIVKR